MTKGATLKAAMKKKRLISAPGIYDMISAKIADRMGFDCLYMTGYGTVASSLGLPDAGLASYTEMLTPCAGHGRGDEDAHGGGCRYRFRRLAQRRAHRAGL